MISKSITILLFTSFVIFSQSDPFPKYNNDTADNEIDLIIDHPFTIKDIKTGQLLTYNVKKRISEVSKFDSKNDSSINAWNGKINYIDLRNLKFIQIEKSTHYGLLFGTLSGFGFGLLTGAIINAVNDDDVKQVNWIGGMNWPNFREFETFGTVILSGLIGAGIGGLAGILLDSSIKEYDTIPLSNLSCSEKKEKIIRLLRNK